MQWQKKEAWVSSIQPRWAMMNRILRKNRIPVFVAGGIFTADDSSLLHHTGIDQCSQRRSGSRTDLLRQPYRRNPWNYNGGRSNERADRINATSNEDLAFGRFLKIRRQFFIIKPVWRKRAKKCLTVSPFMLRCCCGDVSSAS